MDEQLWTTFQYNGSKDHVKADFGVCIKTIFLLYICLQHFDLPFVIEPQHLLWTLYFLKNYNSMHVMSERWNVDTKTFRLWTWRVILALFEYLHTVRVQFLLLTVKISLDNRSFQGKLGTINLVLDATVCPIERPEDNYIQKLMFSGKHKKHAIKYEIAVNIITGVICWVFGGYPASAHDLTVARAGNLTSHLEQNEHVVTDKAYIGLPEAITPIKAAKMPLSRLWNYEVSTAREIVEHVYSRIKNFQCLTQKWRHDLALHPIVFYVICNIVNIDMHFYPVTK